MENNTNKNPQSQAQAGNNTSAQSGQQAQGASHTSTSGKSSQQGTSGKGGLNDITGNLTSKLQQFGSTAAEKVNNLSTTQKVVGGSLLALGAGWIAMNQMNKKGAIGSSSKKMKGSGSYNGR
ncbi:hypothetical protein [Pontibacter liquoris]|uniref:hypothetical protein n=1 Tax=Pontibacter liquoris TaxID=2905677 RepID=UPI001FA7A8B0|nr:hypothetical protein [Pontibacter liquoris]